MMAKGSVSATKRNPLVGAQADLAKKVKQLLNRYETKKLGNIDSPWNTYGAGHSIGDLLFGQSPELLDDMSYEGLKALVSGRTGRIPIPDKRLLDMPVPTPAAGGLGVIKNPGGNWLSGSVEQALKRLKRGMTDNGAEFVRRGLLTPEQAAARPEVPINNFIDNQLTKYVKNRMASPKDELRRLADQGILHFEPEQLSDIHRNRRRKTGFPEEGVSTTPLGSAWENVADASIKPMDVGFYTNPEGSRVAESILNDNTWLSRLNPDDIVYDATENSMGFANWEHLLDELANSLDPNSGLPNQLPDARGKMVPIALSPENMGSLSMEDAVRRVHAINLHRAREAERARKKSADTIRTYPGWNEVKTWDDGYRLVRAPDTVDNEDALEIIRGCGKAGGWCTEGKDRATEYGSGENRLNVLLDPDGRPVAQLTTSSVGADFNKIDDVDWRQIRALAEDNGWVSSFLERPYNVISSGHYANWDKELYDAAMKIAPSSRALEISEVKGLNNMNLDQIEPTIRDKIYGYAEELGVNLDDVD